MTEIDIRLPQLGELIDTLDSIERMVQALDKKVDALTLAAAAPGPVQMDLPLTEKPKVDAPAAKPIKGKTSRASKKGEEVAFNGNGAVEPKTNGEAAEDVKDEDGLRARAVFESRRVSRLFGVGASRAVIKKIAGEGVVNIDDVPAWQLMTLLVELQSL